MPIQECSLPGGKAPYWIVTTNNVRAVDNEAARSIRMMCKLCGVSDDAIIVPTARGFSIKVDDCPAAVSLNAMLNPGDADPNDRTLPPEWGTW